MKRKLYIVLLLLASSSAWAQGTWTLVQHVSKTNCAAGTSCTVTVAATGTGNLLVGVASLNGSSTLISSIIGAGTWTLCPDSSPRPPRSVSSCHPSGGYIDAAYNLSSTPGATSIVFNFSASTTPIALEVLEYSNPYGAVFDTNGTVTNVSCSSSCAGVPLTLSGTNDVIVQYGTASGNITAITSPYTSPADFPNTQGIAASINTASGTAPTWTLNTSFSMNEGALAFRGGCMKGLDTLP